MLLGLYGWGRRNDLDIVLRSVTLEFADLPSDLEGFKVLHLSDLHVDYMPKATAAASSLVAGVEADLCVLTGNFLGDPREPIRTVLRALEKLLAAISSRHGDIAVLSNHDRVDLVEPLESLGMGVLLAERRTISVSDSALRIRGADDVIRFFPQLLPRS